ncbi:hypothetical protein V8C37DRAFT_171680 [Trichoderma ceciliae]
MRPRILLQQPTKPMEVYRLAMILHLDLTVAMCCLAFPFKAALFLLDGQHHSVQGLWLFCQSFIRMWLHLFQISLGIEMTLYLVRLVLVVLGVRRMSWVTQEYKPIVMHVYQRIGRIIRNQLTRHASYECYE